MADPADLLTVEGFEIGEGERHYTLVSLAGLLHDGERSAEDIAEILRSVRDAYFTDGKGDAEIDSIAAYAVRGEPFVFEPYDLPSFSIGTRVFPDQASLDRWIAQNQDTFSKSWALLEVENIPKQRVLVTLDGQPLIREQTVTEVLVYRGIGKSMVVGSLIRILTASGEFCGFQSAGG